MALDPWRKRKRADGAHIDRLSKWVLLWRSSLRRARLDAVAGIDACDGAVSQHLAQRGVDSLTQLVVRADHADREIPVEIRIVREGCNRTQCGLRMSHIVPADRDRRECGRLHLA